MTHFWLQHISKTTTCLHLIAYEHSPLCVRPNIWKRKPCLGVNLSNPSDKCCLIATVSKLSVNQQTPVCHCHPACIGHLPLLGNSSQILFTFWVTLYNVWGGCSLDSVCLDIYRLKSSNELVFFKKGSGFIVHAITEWFKIAGQLAEFLKWGTSFFDCTL